MSDTEPLDLDAHDRVARTLHDRADAICADRDGDLNQVDELLAAETSIEALIAEVRRLREETENHECRQTVARHGTRSKYIRGCRCDLCKESEAEYSRKRREQYANLTIAADDPRHGTISCYNHYGCRCEACVAATSEYSRARRAAMKGSDA